MRGDSSVCWWETPPLTSSSSVLNSNLFWEAAVIFAKDLLFLNSSLWFDIFYSWPRGYIFFPTLCSQVEPFIAMPGEQVAVKYLAQGCFGRYWCAGVQTIDTAEQNFQPLDHVDLTCSQNNEVWQLTSCKRNHGRLMDGEDDLWTDERCAGSWMVRRMDGWKDRGMDGWLEGRMGLMMAACHVSRHCFDNKSLAMASLLSCLCLFCHLLYSGGNGVSSTGAGPCHTHTHTPQ